MLSVRRAQMGVLLLYKSQNQNKNKILVHT